MFPAIDQYDPGMLDVGDGHQMHWESCGNPEGKPAVVLHGGLGSGCRSWQRQLFDPNRYRAVRFDQRGCGRGRPLANEPAADLGTNTTGDLVADIEKLREHLGIDRWTVLGMSSGTTLGLAYAQTHPERVTALVLALVTTTSRREVDAYAMLPADPDRAVHDRAAREWCTWEDAHVSLSASRKPDPRYEDPEFRLWFARLVTHYGRHEGGTPATPTRSTPRKPAPDHHWKKPWKTDRMTKSLRCCADRIPEPLHGLPRTARICGLPPKGFLWDRRLGGPCRTSRRLAASHPRFGPLARLLLSPAA
jgi:pimeloyl-ACP methyl ester carboxylesterase